MNRRTAFVTGASQGIGAAIALALARDGYDVAVSSTRPEKLSEVVSGIVVAGARAVPVALDVRAPESIEQAMAQVVSACGHLDVLVNNAGVPLKRLALEVTPAEWEAVIDVNLKGTFFMSQQMGRHLVKNGRPGCIVSIASTHGMVALEQRSAYGIAKAAIIHMTRMLSIEWAEHGIRVNALAPGRHAVTRRIARRARLSRRGARPHTAAPVRHRRGDCGSGELPGEPGGSVHYRSDSGPRRRADVLLTQNRSQK